MSNPELPERASLDYLKRRAKEHLRELRQRDPHAKLADAQLAIARGHGFTSWRAMKAEIDRRQAPSRAAFFAACASGDIERLRELLSHGAGLVHERNAAGSTGLHLAARRAEALRLLLEHGANVNARDGQDNALALHLAARRGARDAVRVLVDAGSDVQGAGDVHRLEVIGWACCLGPSVPREVVDLLLAHGAHHHLFSAIACQDTELIQRLCEDDPEAITRRLSRFEQRQSVLHYVVRPPDGIIGGDFRTGPHHAMLDLLIDLGADLDAEDDTGRTPLMLAMLAGDREAMRRLHAAGAKQPTAPAAQRFEARIAELGASVSRLDAMLPVADMLVAIAWYRAIGFAPTGRHEADGELDWVSLTLGEAHVMLVPGGKSGAAPGRERVSFFLRTPRLDELYRLLEQRQLERSAAALAGNDEGAPEIRFRAKLHDTHYGSREFQLVDPDGYALNFIASE